MLHGFAYLSHGHHVNELRYMLHHYREYSRPKVIYYTMKSVLSPSAAGVSGWHGEDGVPRR